MQFGLSARTTAVPYALGAGRSGSGPLWATRPGRSGRYGIVTGVPGSSDAGVVVVGASIAGLRACEALRTDGYAGKVTLIGAEPHLPYDRPPLSKKLLAGEWEPDRIAL